MGQQVVKYIGFDATENHRVKSGGPTFAVMAKQREVYDIQYPLRQWGWDREECKRVIAAEGLPVPDKSACFMCPASKRHELYELDLPQLETAVRMEETYRHGKHWRTAAHPRGASTTVGLGRKWRWSSVLAERLSDRMDEAMNASITFEAAERQLRLF
jgi:hypothetical protein